MVIMAMRQYNPYERTQFDARIKDEAKWAALAGIAVQIKEMAKQGKEVVYANIEGNSPRWRAMVRHYWLNHGKVYEDYDYYWYERDNA